MLTAIRRLAKKAYALPNSGFGMKSQMCTEAQLCSPTFRRWAEEMREPFQLHRKLWEWCYITQAFDELGVLQPGKKGLGFAVGVEPLTTLFAARGCEILATDLDPSTSDPNAAHWRAAGQHCTQYGLLNKRGICSEEQMKRVQMRYVDMNAIPDDLTGFDFLWSSCSLEHLGTMEHGMKFMENMVRCLKPGGVAVHTTEYNVLATKKTIEAGPAVLFRKQDIETMVRRVEAIGCAVVERDYHAGDSKNDWNVDKPPYQSNVHLKLDFQGYTVTSIGIIVKKHLQ